MSYQPSPSIQNFFDSLQIEEPRHYDRIPAILDYLTYVEEVTDKKSGEKKYYRKRLSLGAKELYRIIKQRSGKINKCWAEGEDLADHLGCDEDSITKYKKILCMPIEQLEGNTLINIETQYKMDEKDGHKFARTKHIISVNHIWHYNNAFMDNFDTSIFPKKCEEISKNDYEVAIEKMRQPTLTQEIVHNSGGSPKPSEEQGGGLRKEKIAPQGGNPKRSDVNKLQSSSYSVSSHYTADAARVTSSMMKDCLFSENPMARWLYDYFDQHYCTQILKEYSSEAIELARRYFEERRSKKRLDNPAGYIRRIFENKWYLQLEG